MGAERRRRTEAELDAAESMLAAALEEVRTTRAALRGEAANRWIEPRIHAMSLIAARMAGDCDANTALGCMHSAERMAREHGVDVRVDRFSPGRVDALFRIEARDGSPMLEGDENECLAWSVRQLRLARARAEASKIDAEVRHDGACQDPAPGAAKRSRL